MEYRRMGNSGLRVSVAGLGTNNFGRRCNAEETAAVIHRAIDLGVNFIDTADVYGDTLSEEYIGKAIKGHRRDLVIATKFERPVGEGPLHSGTSRRHVMEAVEDSLRRLDVDAIDLYQIHYWNDETPLEETLRALDDLVHRGDVRYIGCSNFAAWQIVEAQWIARSERLVPLVSTQNQYNLLERGIERDVLPVARRYGMGLIPYFPLASGFLTGKYHQGEPPPPGTRFAGSSNFARRVLTDTNFARLAVFERFAEERDHSVGQLALAWLAAQPGVASVISGATRPEQVEENVRALEWQLTAADLRSLDEALKEQPATAR
ncbi:MAG TPA: aldo/keto reductase [Chloroflexota bacterium]|nr:aldo/keto reductase [Chloroflexota bacterium]